MGRSLDSPSSALNRVAAELGSSGGAVRWVLPQGGNPYPVSPSCRVQGRGPSQGSRWPSPFLGPQLLLREENEEEEGGGETPSGGLKALAAFLHLPFLSCPMTMRRHKARPQVPSGSEAAEVPKSLRSEPRVRPARAPPACWGGGGGSPAPPTCLGGPRQRGEPSQ